MYKPTLSRYREELVEALLEGRRALTNGSSVEAVETAVARMEDCGTFNAGRGAVLTSDGRTQLDAAIMVGKGLKAGAVGACSCTHSAITLARYVMEHTKHGLIVGEDLRPIAKEAGLPIESLRPTLLVRERYNQAKEAASSGTVGAVAIDGEGTPASAVSTGGLWLKRPGRVGDSAIICAGAYADSAAGAASATGEGEEIMKNALCWEACRLMAGRPAMSAAKLAIGMMTRRSGRGLAGVITVDLRGGIGYAYNTRRMGRAYYDIARQRAIVEV